MKLKHGWAATFLDGPRHIALTKPGGRTVRNVVLRWEYPFLKAIDPVSGVVVTGLSVSLPDDVRRPLIEAARERWGA